MRRFVRMFKPEFAARVAAGEKRQTVRPLPVRMPKAGDWVSLRTWTGRPYRSQQRVLREAVIRRVSRCIVRASSVLVDGVEQEPDRFAAADGFKCYSAMADWFEREYFLPFSGIVIYW